MDKWPKISHCNEREAALKARKDKQVLGIGYFLSSRLVHRHQFGLFGQLVVFRELGIEGLPSRNHTQTIGIVATQ